MRPFSEYLSEYFQDEIWYNFSSRLKRLQTRDSYLYYVNSICDFCKKDFLEITQKDAELFLNFLLQKSRTKELSLSSVGLICCVLMSVSNYVLENTDASVTHGYNTNPFSKIDIPEMDLYIGMDEIPTDEDVDRIKTASKQDFRLFLAVHLVLRCALTTSEVCNLKLTDLLKENNSVTKLRVTKEGDTRIIDVPKDAAILLNNYLTMIYPEQEYLFLNNKKQQISVRTMQRLFKRYIPEDYTFMSLRHYCIVGMLISGMTTDEVCTYVGIEKRWMLRYNTVVEQFKGDAKW